MKPMHELMLQFPSLATFRIDVGDRNQDKPRGRFTVGMDFVQGYLYRLSHEAGCPSLMPVDRTGFFVSMMSFSVLIHFAPHKQNFF